jgi:CRP-like cAMP-binding protein
LLEGGTPAEVMLLRTGRVKVVAAGPDGTETLLSLRGPGELVGEYTALLAGPHSATVVAVDDVEVLAVPIARFRNFLGEFPEAATSVAGAVVARLNEADRRRAAYLGSDVRARLAALLLELADQYGVARQGTAGRVVDLPLSQHDLAAAIGASRESVARAFAAFRAAGLVETARRRTVVLDPAALRAEADR